MPFVGAPVDEYVLYAEQGDCVVLRHFSVEE
jgi:hypothetical protein